MIRAWERRYGAVEPHRAETNRRLYSEKDVDRLTLLRRLTQQGHTISQIATLSHDRLRKMAKETGAEPVTVKTTSKSPEALVHECLGAVKVMDAITLEKTLDRAAIELGNQGVLQQVIAPLAHALGELWQEGGLTAAHEHFATAAVRLFLAQASRPFASARQPTIIVSTPSGQLHELGALLAGAAAANMGWHVIYLGAGLPAAEIAGAAALNDARAVALSIVYPEDDPSMEKELKRLRQLLAQEVQIVIGGRAAPAYVNAIRGIDATLVKDIPSFTSALNAMRGTGRKASSKKKLSLQNQSD